MDLQLQEFVRHLFHNVIIIPDKVKKATEIRQTRGNILLQNPQQAGSLTRGYRLCPKSLAFIPSLCYSVAELKSFSEGGIPMGKINSFFIARPKLTLFLMWFWFAVALVLALVLNIFFSSMSFFQYAAYLIIPVILAFYFRSQFNKGRKAQAKEEPAAASSRPASGSKSAAKTTGSTKSSAQSAKKKNSRKKKKKR